MKKMLLSIIIPILLLAILFFIFPDSHYIDYYLHYINTASDPLFDWIVIMMGGISVNDVSMMLIATLLIIYSFALFGKDEDRKTNVKLKHVVYGILGTAIIMRIIYLCLFAINNSTCDEYKTINTQITDISDNKITVIVDSIPLSKSINSDDAKQAFIGDKININVAKGSLGYYCLGDEYKIIKSATKTTENIVDKTKEADSKAKSINSINETKPAEETKPIAEAKPAEEAKSNSQAKPAPKRYSKEERAQNEVRVANETEKYNAILDSIDRYEQMLESPLSGKKEIEIRKKVDKLKERLDNVSDKQLLKRLMRNRKAQKEESYDWYERNEQNFGLILTLIILFDLCVVGGIYFFVYKHYHKSIDYRLLILAFVGIIFGMRDINDSNITHRKIIKSTIIDKNKNYSSKKLFYRSYSSHRSYSYWVKTKYKGEYISKRVSEETYNFTAKGDTLELEMRGGILGLNLQSDYYRVIPANTRRDYIDNKKESNKYGTDNYSPESNIAEYNNEKLFWNKIAEQIEQNRKIEGTLSLLLVVDNTADKHIKKLDIYRCPKGLDKQIIYDFINKSKEVKSFTNGTYLMVVHIIKGYIQEKSLKKIETKEDFESLIFEFLYNKMPTVNGLRGSAFIDITVKADGTPEAVVTQSLNPKVDNVALEFVKSIPWEPKQNESKYRLTIMYAKGKLWQVKVWNMD